MDNDLINILKEGQSLVFRGSGEENVVLCTNSQTYDVKEADTSNSLLLLSDFRWSCEADLETKERNLQEKEVLGVFHKYFELRPCKPRLQKLRAVLEESMYRGKEFEEELENLGVKTYTFHQLLDTVQASEMELQEALQKEMVCCVKDKWRVLSHDYHFRVLSHILNLLDENSWSLNSVPKEETVKELCDLVPEEILGQCFDWYMEPTGGTDTRGNPLYSLSEPKVCRFLAEVLLRGAGNFDLKSFLSTWQNSVPEGVVTDVTYLEGIALMNKKIKPETIWYFPETSLPEDITERFRILFQTQEKWTFDEIRPYIERLASDKMNVNALLTKYARASSVNGIKYYGARHAK
ncbi:sister chromatid cohesion protein DCC1 isoform X2 [Anabrus simplex]